jgi:hypothetical protein
MYYLNKIMRTKYLIEYKKKMETEGDGDFNQGRAKMWKTKIEA